MITSQYYYSFRKYTHLIRLLILLLLLIMEIFEMIGVGNECHADED